MPGTNPQSTKEGLRVFQQNHMCSHLSIEVTVTVKVWIDLTLENNARNFMTSIIICRKYQGNREPLRNKEFNSVCSIKLNWYYKLISQHV